MPISLEDHDYIRLSENPALKISDNPNISCGVSEKNNNGLNMKATELRLGLPGSESPKRENNVLDNVVLKGLSSGSKRGFSDTINGGSGKWGLSVGVGSEDGLSVDVQQSPKVVQEKKPLTSSVNGHGAKAQVVGWPPIRSFRKNSMATNPPTKSDEDNDTKSEQGCLYVKVSMDGAPYLRKIDLNTYHSYKDLSSALEKMFSSFTIGQCGTQGGLSKNGLKDIIHGSEYVLTFEDKDGDWMLVGDLPWEMFTDTCKKLRIMKSSDAIGLAPRAMEKSKSRN